MTGPLQPEGVPGLGARSFEDALAECLDAVESGEATPAEAVSRYPQFPELGPLVELAQALRALPDPAWNTPLLAASPPPPGEGEGEGVPQPSSAFELALAECLEALERGESTPAEAAARYPQFTDLADLLRLAAAIRALPAPERPARQPAPGAACALETSGQPAAPAELIRIGGRRAAVRALPIRPALRAAAALAPLLLGWSLVAPAAQAAIPGEPLYPVKRLWEQVELAVALDDASRAEARLAHLSARVAEAAHPTLDPRLRDGLLADAEVEARFFRQSAARLPLALAERLNARAAALRLPGGPVEALLPPPARPGPDARSAPTQEVGAPAEAASPAKPAPEPLVQASRPANPATRSEGDKPRPTASEHRALGEPRVKPEPARSEASPTPAPTGIPTPTPPPALAAGVPTAGPTVAPARTAVAPPADRPSSGSVARADRPTVGRAAPSSEQATARAGATPAAPEAGTSGPGRAQAPRGNQPDPDVDDDQRRDRREAVTHETSPHGLPTVEDEAAADEKPEHPVSSAAQKQDTGAKAKDDDKPNLDEKAGQDRGENERRPEREDASKGDDQAKDEEPSSGADRLKDAGRPGADGAARGEERARGGEERDRAAPARTPTPGGALPNVQAPRGEPPKAEPAKSEPPRREAPRTDPPRPDPPRTDGPKVEPSTSGSPRPDETPRNGNGSRSEDRPASGSSAASRDATSGPPDTPSSRTGHEASSSAPVDARSRPSGRHATPPEASRTPSSAPPELARQSAAVPSQPSQEGRRQSGEKPAAEQRAPATPDPRERQAPRPR